MTVRPLVTVFNASNNAPAGGVTMPEVFLSPIRPDQVRFVHTQLSKNSRQAYAVSKLSGYQSSAESWGTGRAVARIPRAAGGGTHRAGQGAFGNMCRGGGMYAPTRTWRRWHRKVNLTQRRHAVASALAASAVPAIVAARGHRIDAIAEFPVVVTNEMEMFTKTKDAVKMLKTMGCGEELERVIEGKKIRAGKGKRRNRRYIVRRGPLIVYAGDRDNVRAYANIPGVDVCHVSRLSLLKLAPGGTMGRLVIYSEAAFQQLESIWGTYSSGTAQKTGYVLPRSVLTNPDIGRVINSNEVQSMLNPAKEVKKVERVKKNPLKNKAFRRVLNPAYDELKARKSKP